MQIGGYELLEKIGSEGAFSVYSGRRSRDGRPVTIQVPAARHPADNSFRKWLQREFTAAKAVDSPFVLQYLDYVETEDTAAVVTQQRPSLNLRALISLNNGLPLDETLEYCRQIARGLFACHCCGMVHRHVTPDSIYITDDKTVKIANFGLAGILDTTTLTMTGAMVGTPEYAPPEHLYCAPKDIRGDTYTFGIVIWEMLTGHNPFEGDSLTEIFREKTHQPLPPPSALNPATPPWMDLLVADMTAPDPDQRPKSLQQVTAALEKRFHFHVAEPNDREGNCLACGYPAPPALWFCPYCGQADDDYGKTFEQASVLLITEAADIETAEKFLTSTFGNPPRCDLRKRHEKKEDIPIIENVTPSENLWLTDALQTIGCSVSIRPVSAWYYKMGTFLFFLCGLILLLFFRPPPEAGSRSATLLSLSFKLACIGGLTWMIFQIFRRHYAKPWQIPIEWAKGTFTYDPFANHLSSANRILSSFVLIGITGVVCTWAAIVLLALFDRLQAGLVTGGWASLVVDNSFLMLLAQPVIIKLFVGEINVPMAAGSPNTGRGDRIQARTDFYLCEGLRRLAVDVPDKNFRYLIAECLEQYLCFHRFKGAGPDLPQPLVRELEERFFAAAEATLSMGKQIRKLADTAAESFREKAEKKQRLVEQHMDQGAGRPSDALVQEWKQAQDMILQHEAAVETTNRNFNNIRLVVGSMHTVILQIFSAQQPHKTEETDIGLSVKIISEALSAVSVRH